LLLQTSQI